MSIKVLLPKKFWFSDLFRFWKCRKQTCSFCQFQKPFNESRSNCLPKRIDIEPHLVSVLQAKWAKRNGLVARTILAFKNSKAESPPRKSKDQ